MPRPRALLDDRIALAVNYVSEVLVVGIVVLMAFKVDAAPPEWHPAIL